MSTSLAINTLAAKEMLCTRVTSMVVLPDRALTTKNEADRPTIKSLKGEGLNMVALPREMLYILHDGVIVELRDWDSHVLKVMRE